MNPWAATCRVPGCTWATGPHDTEDAAQRALYHHRTREHQRTTQQEGMTCPS